MNLLRTASIAALVKAGFALALALMAALALAAWTSSGQVSGLLDQVVHEQVPAYIATAQIHARQAAAQACLSGLIFERDGERRRGYFKDLDAALAGVVKGLLDYEHLPKGVEERKAWTSLKPVAERWLAKARAQRSLEADRDRALAAGGDAALAAQALAGVQACRDLDSALDERFAWLHRATDDETQEMRTDAEGQSRALRVTLLAALLLCGAVLTGAAFAIARRVSGAVRGLIEAAGRLGQAVSEGRLDVRGDQAQVSVEFRPVVAGFNATMDAFTRPLRLTADYVDRISRGDLPPKITDPYQGDFNLIKGNLNTCLDTLAALEADMARVAEAAVEGRLEQRADAQQHQGAYRRIAEGVNRTVATLVGHLDAMPAPAMIIDRDFKIRYLNGAALRMAGRELGQVVGRRCSDVFRMGDCGTERCACARAMRDGRVASGETAARPGKDALEVGYSGVPLKDGAGKIVGALEVLSDLTAAKAAVRQSQKVSEYQARETSRVVAALEKVSHGDLSVELAVAAGDADTAEARQTFQNIAEAIQRSAEAVQGLTRDVASLSESAIAGTLTARADAARHQGDFRKIVEGVNRTLDAVIAPMDEAAAVLEKLAGRDLRARVTGRYQGDHARIKDSVNATGEALHEALAQVAASVEQVSSASTQIASSAQAVAAGASEQAASLEEITSSLDSVSGMTRQSADNAGQASALAQLARGAATEGAGAVEQMQGAMRKIKASAESTSQIIKDINEIAFQTNLLALNAAVEAARAGDAGRGFAVVAEEVRSLALRSKEAATKTEALIRESVRQAGEGEVTAALVGAKLGEIVAGIGKVSDIVSEIAAAAREQATGIGQVGQAIGEMDKVTQQNASSAEQSSSAATELTGQSEELSGLVAAFQLSRRGGGPALKRPEPQAPRAAQARTAASGPPARAVVANDRDRRFPMDDEAELRRF